MAEGHRHVRGYRVSGRPSAPATARPGWRVWVSGSFLAIAILFGGGGTPSPSTELAVELAAVVAIMAWAWFAANDRGHALPAVDRPLFILAGLVAAVPLLQLIPLPPAIWHHLPGREIEVQALTLVGRGGAWMPLSESPSRTFASVLSLIPPVAMLFMASRLRDRDRLTLIGVAAAVGLLAAVFGVLQLAGGNASWVRFYSNDRYMFATGFQANRNADADILLIATLAVAAWAAGNNRFRQSRHAKLLAVAALVFLGLSIVLTGSRTGVVLIPVALIASAAMFVRLETIKNRRIIWAVLGGVVVLAGVIYFLSTNARVQRTLQRFDSEEAVRPEIWKDTLYAIEQHWPVGSGIGTFQPVFAASERLEFVRPEFSNRAHNDYLEYALEAGVVAPIILIVIIIFAAVRLKRIIATDENRTRRAVGIFVLGVLLVLLLHSLVDYPERSLSLAVLTGMLGGLLGRSVSGGGRAVRSSDGVVL